MALKSNEASQESLLRIAAHLFAMPNHSLLLLIPQLLSLQLQTLTSKWPTNEGLHFPEGADLDARDFDEFENDPWGV